MVIKFNYNNIDKLDASLKHLQQKKGSLKLSHERGDKYRRQPTCDFTSCIS